MAFRDTEQLLIAFKARFGIQHTAMSNREWFAESLGLVVPTYAEDIWLQFPPSTNKYSYHNNQTTLDAAIVRTRTWNGTTWISTPSGGTIPVEKLIMPLTLLSSTNNQAWMALKVPVLTIDPDDIIASLRLMDGINAATYGSDFLPRIFWDDGSTTAPGQEITTTALADGWLYDTASGILINGSSISDTFIPQGNAPIWVVWYRYVGTKGLSGAGGFPPLITPFTFADLATGSLSIGTSLAGAVVSECTLDVVTPFTAGTTFTIGDSSVVDSLCGVDDTDPTLVCSYKKFLNSLLAGPTEFKVYLTTGTPIAGSGSIIVYFE